MIKRLFTIKYYLIQLRAPRLIMKELFRLPQIGYARRPDSADPIHRWPDVECPRRDYPIEVGFLFDHPL